MNVLITAQVKFSLEIPKAEGVAQRSIELKPGQGAVLSAAEYALVGTELAASQQNGRITIQQGI